MRSTLGHNPCKTCGAKTHTAFKCPYRTNKRLQVRKPIKQVGIVALKWQKTRREWFRLNEPDHQGYYYCYICGKAMTQEETTLDHKMSRGRNPKLRYVQSNLAACCYQCNADKGSYNINEYLEKRHATDRNTSQP